MNEQSQTGIRPDYTPHARAERLISAGRFVLAFSSFVAVYLEPSTPERHQHISYALLAGYALYALVVLVLTWRRPPQPSLSAPDGPSRRSSRRPAGTGCDPG